MMEFDVITYFVVSLTPEYNTNFEQDDRGFLELRGLTHKALL